MSTTTRKLQLRQELSNLQQRDLSVADYTSKIKDIGERDGPDLPRRVGAKVRSVLNGCMHPGEDAVLFQLTVDAPGRRDRPHTQAPTPTVGCCTRREIGPMGVEDEESRCAMEAADEIKEGGTEVMPTATPDPPGIWRVEAMRTSKGKPSRSASTVARKATGKASAGRSAPIRSEPGPETVPNIPTKEMGSACTTPKEPEELEKGLSS